MGMHTKMKDLISVKPFIKILRITSKPVVAFFMFNFVMVGMHWSSVVNLMVTNTVAHFFIHSIMLLVSLNMWVPVCLLYTSPSPRDGLLSRMPSSA